MIVRYKDCHQTIFLTNGMILWQVGFAEVFLRRVAMRLSTCASDGGRHPAEPGKIISIVTCQRLPFRGPFAFLEPDLMGKLKSNAAPAEVEGASNITSISAAAKRSAASVTADAKPSASLPPEAALVVLGRDDGGKPHASWFGAADAELAIKAAGMMKFKVLPITSDEHRAAASGLAAGRVFASGRCFSPFCREAAHDALEAFSEAYAPPAPVEPEPAMPPAITGTPQRWEDIGPGSLVLAMAGDDWGWFEAVVTEARGDDLFVLRWRDWPDDAEFARRRDGLALLPVQVVETA